MKRGYILLLGVAGLVGCSLDWSSLDPREGSASGATTTAAAGGATGSTTSAGAGGATTTSTSSSASGGAGGQGNDPNCLVPLTDDFGALDLGLWDVDLDGSSCGANFSQGVMTLACEADDPPRHAELRSRAEYDFETCGVMVDLQRFMNGSSGVFGLELNGLAARYAFEVEDNNITSIQTVSGNDKMSSNNFSPVEHRWWWIGGRDGCAAWDFSSDGVEWEEFRRRCDMSLGELQVVLFVRAEADAPDLEATFGGINAP